MTDLWMRTTPEETEGIRREAEGELKAGYFAVLERSRPFNSEMTRCPTEEEACLWQLEDEVRGFIDGFDQSTFPFLTNGDKQKITAAKRAATRSFDILRKSEENLKWRWETAPPPPEKQYISKYVAGLYRNMPPNRRNALLNRLGGKERPVGKLTRKPRIAIGRALGVRMHDVSEYWHDNEPENRDSFFGKHKQYFMALKAYKEVYINALMARREGRTDEEIALIDVHLDKLATENYKIMAVQLTVFALGVAKGIHHEMQDVERGRDQRLRASGEPYIEHPRRSVLRFVYHVLPFVLKNKSLGLTPLVAAIIVLALHDTLEDSVSDAETVLGKLATWIDNSDTSLHQLFKTLPDGTDVNQFVNKTLKSLHGYADLKLILEPALRVLNKNDKLSEEEAKMALWQNKFGKKTVKIVVSLVDKSMKQKVYEWAKEIDEADEAARKERASSGKVGSQKRWKHAYQGNLPGMGDDRPGKAIDLKDPPKRLKGKPLKSYEHFPHSDDAKLDEFLVRSYAIPACLDFGEEGKTDYPPTKMLKILMQTIRASKLEERMDNILTLKDGIHYQLRILRGTISRLISDVVFDASPVQREHLHNVVPFAIKETRDAFLKVLGSVEYSEVTDPSERDADIRMLAFLNGSLDAKPTELPEFVDPLDVLDDASLQGMRLYREKRAAFSSANVDTPKQGQVA